MNDSDLDNILYYCMCTNDNGCGVLPITLDHYSEEEAAAAWNMRHVETCHDKNGFDESLGFECTVCRTMVDSYMQTTCSDKREQFRYCPNCGREVER